MGITIEEDEFYEEIDANNESIQLGKAIEGTYFRLERSLENAITNKKIYICTYQYVGYSPKREVFNISTSQIEHLDAKLEVIVCEFEGDAHYEN